MTLKKPPFPKGVGGIKPGGTGMNQPEFNLQATSYPLQAQDLHPASHLTPLNLHLRPQLDDLTGRQVIKR